jgi:predicted DNA-binding transcriptional regulator YafY
MSKHGMIKRYMLIIEKINSNHAPSFFDIDAHLRKNGFEYSKRTIDRDIENIRNDFGIEIVYNRSSNNYYIDKEKSVNLETFNRFLEIAGVADLLSEGLNKKKNILSYISFESENLVSKGTEMLQPILSAILNHKEISFTHENFQKKTFKTIKLYPYLLKEYQDRWYVVGTLDKKKTIRTYGLDRMTELKETGEEFVPNAKIIPKELFENVIGLVYSTHELCDVVLSFTPNQAKYIKTLPLHHSQIVLKEDAKECVVKLKIIPNYEFKQRVLMQGANVKVIEPQWFADEVAGDLLAAAKLY